MIIWYVDDLQILHVEKKVMEGIIKESTNDSTWKSIRIFRHDTHYLTNVKVKISIQEYADKMLTIAFRHEQGMQHSPRTAFI